MVFDLWFPQYLPPNTFFTFSSWKCRHWILLGMCVCVCHVFRECVFKSQLESRERAGEKYFYFCKLWELAFTLLILSKHVRTYVLDPFSTNKMEWNELKGKGGWRKRDFKLKLRGTEGRRTCVSRGWEKNLKIENEMTRRLERRMRTRETIVVMTMRRKCKENAHPCSVGGMYERRKGGKVKCVRYMENWADSHHHKLTFSVWLTAIKLTEWNQVTNILYLYPSI